MTTRTFPYADGESAKETLDEIMSALGYGTDEDNWPPGMTIPEAIGKIIEDRDKARANYAFMVQRAMNEKLDGYRELGARAAEAEAERDKAIRDRAFTEEWYAVRFERLKDLCKEHGLWDKAAAIMANGTEDTYEPPSYAADQRLEGHALAGAGCRQAVPRGLRTAHRPFVA